MSSLAHSGMVRHEETLHGDSQFIKRASRELTFTPLRPHEFAFAAEERSTVTILFGGMTWKHERLIEGIVAGAGYLWSTGWKESKTHGKANKAQSRIGEYFRRRGPCRTSTRYAVAGKADPEDREGQRMIQEWAQFSRWQEVQRHVVFLSDYDMSLAEQLVQGVDVWINTPRRPWEACGTSGMKVLVNGGLNLSSLDGWWAEAYDPSLGWSVGDHQNYTNEAMHDAAEAEQLYAVVENEVIPLFYLPAEAYTKRTGNRGDLAVQIWKWQAELRTYWSEIHFRELEVIQDENEYLIRVRMYLGTVCPDHVCVKLFADNHDEIPFISEISQAGELVDAQGGFVFEAKVPAARPASDYTVRIVAASIGWRFRWKSR